MNRPVTAFARAAFVLAISILVATSCGGASGPGPKGVADLGQMPSGSGWSCFDDGKDAPCFRPDACEQNRDQLIAAGHSPGACTPHNSPYPWCFTRTWNGEAGYECTPDRDACQANASRSARGGSGATNCAEWP